jgi:hypothetical protein
VWTGGYDAQHSSILATVRDDVMFIEEAVGAGEVAISDDRMPVDCDVVERDAHRWLRFCREHDGPPDRLTFSSDASATRPGLL